MALRVLLVDDSPVARATIGGRLGAHGASVTLIASASEALAVDARGFAAALLDFDLGDGYGPAVAHRLRLDAPSLRVAFLTAGGAPADVEQAARALGPVFDKATDTEHAIRWILSMEEMRPPSGG